MKKTEPFDVADEEVWPAVPLEAWHDTCTTLHLWTQIVGKIRMARTPLVNHWWNTTLYVTCRGLSTSSIPYRGRNFHIDFDFMAHELRIGTTTGDGRSFPLEPMAVADFYAKTMQALRELDIEVAIYPVPVELEEAIPFARDRQHASYDRDHVHRYWRALVQVDNVFSEFRSRYLGKVSPVHFFWGAFDLAVTRFSGRTAPRHPGGAPNVGDWVMHEAYSHEVSSAGFWPGQGLGEPAFYAYAYPEPEGFADYPVHPEAAYYHQTLREFVLPCEAVRTAPDPREVLLSFLQSTYEAAAVPGKWDRTALERASATPA